MPTARKKPNSEEKASEVEVAPDEVVPEPEPEPTLEPEPEQELKLELEPEPEQVPVPVEDPKFNPRAWRGPPRVAPITPNRPNPFPSLDSKYKTSRWGNHDNYECTLCPYSTLEKENMLAHLIERHSGVESNVKSSTHS